MLSLDVASGPLAGADGAGLRRHPGKVGEAGLPQVSRVRQLPHKRVSGLYGEMCEIDMFGSHSRAGHCDVGRGGPPHVPLAFPRGSQYYPAVFHNDIMDCPRQLVGI